MKTAGLPWKESESIAGAFFDLGMIGESRVVAVKTQIGALGSDGTIGSAHFYQEKTGATGIICLGMAFGLDRSSQPPGTVLVSEALFPYDDRKVCPDGRGLFQYTYDPEKRVRPCKEALLHIFREHAKSWDSATEGFNVQFGTLLAGSAKIECTMYRKLLVSWCPAPVIGGEMEGVGFLSLRDPGAGIVVKGICDFGEDNQTDEVKQHREKACANAAGFVINALLRWNPSAN